MQVSGKTLSRSLNHFHVSLVRYLHHVAYALKSLKLDVHAFDPDIYVLTCVGIYSALLGLCIRKRGRTPQPLPAGKRKCSHHRRSPKTKAREHIIGAFFLTMLFCHEAIITHSRCYMAHPTRLDNPTSSTNQTSKFTNTCSTTVRPSA